MASPPMPPRLLPPLLMSWLLLCLVSGATLAGSPLAGPPNVIVITLDTTRADHLGAYGHFQATSQWFDQWAARGVLFERAYAPMAQTLPSHATIFTGLSPREHGAAENHLSLPEQATTLAEVLSGHGYLTAAFTSARVLDAESGLEQGFDHFDQTVPGGQAPKHLSRRADAVTDAALAWLDQRQDGRPFLLWVHYFDAHAPYDPPAPFDTALPKRNTVLALIDRFEQGRWSARHDPEPGLLEAYARRWLDYDREIRFADHELGRLLRGLTKRGCMDRAVLAIAGDHGEGLFEHDLAGHGLEVWEELVHVPLLVVAPDDELAGTRVVQPVRLAALHDILLRLALGDDMPPAVSGGTPDAWTSLRRTGALPLAPVFVERPHYSVERLLQRAALDPRARAAPGELLGVIMGPLKLIRWPDGSSELYDLSSDPDELEDRSLAMPEAVRSLQALLDHWLKDHPVADAPARPISEERQRALEQLGYGH